MIASKMGFTEEELLATNLEELERAQRIWLRRVIEAGRDPSGYLGWSTYKGTREAGYR